MEKLGKRECGGGACSVSGDLCRFTLASLGQQSQEELFLRGRGGLTVRANAFLGALTAACAEVMQRAR